MKLEYMILGYDICNNYSSNDRKVVDSKVRRYHQTTPTQFLDT